MTDALQQLQGFRDRRAGREFDLSITRMIETAADSATRHHRRLGELIELWRGVIPASLAGQTEIIALRGGVLEVAVDSAAVRFQVDRELRGGALEALRSRYRGNLVRVRLRLGESDGPAAPPAQRGRRGGAV